MSNAWFRFKQFHIDQADCAMKVSTDACIQGAWTPVPPGARRVLDVGAGTGLLSLMLAQRDGQIDIDAIELDAKAAAQAARNAAGSPFAGRIRVLEGDARTFIPEAPYDLLICNPPFFTDSLHGPDAERNHARHNVTFQQQDLKGLADISLQPAGVVSAIWPPLESAKWALLMKDAGYHCIARLSVRDREDSRITRVITGHSRQRPEACREETLVIRQADGSYTGPFISLLSPFYLAL